MNWPELVALGGLAMAAWSDYRSRSVPNAYWLILLALLAPFVLTEIATDWRAGLVRLGVALLFAAAMFGLWLGGVFKAGDAKGLMVLGLALTPVGYYDPLTARFFVPFDALPVAMLAAEGWRRASHAKSTPFFVILFPVVAITMVAGGLLWWPVAWLAGVVL